MCILFCSLILSTSETNGNRLTIPIDSETGAVPGSQFFVSFS